jgi:hypothetical protein
MTMPTQAYPRNPCLHGLYSLFKSPNQKQAEEILKEYRPYDQIKLKLEPLSEQTHTSVFKGIDPLHPSNEFVIKITALAEALNDYYALRVIKAAQSEMRHKIKIVDSVLLTPKSREISLITKVVQKNTLAKGRSLAEILADPAESAARKAELTQKFTDWRTDLEAALSRQNFEVSTHAPGIDYFKTHAEMMSRTPDALKAQPHMLLASKPWESEFNLFNFNQSGYQNVLRLSKGQINTFILDHEDLMMVIKSDNVFVDAKNELTLIDPF